MTIEMPDCVRNFVAISVHEATYESKQGHQTIILEERTKPDATSLLFTTIDDQEVYANSIPDLILKRSDCLSLTIVHTVAVLWNSTPQKAELTEIFLPYSCCPGTRWSTRLKMRVDNKLYETTDCTDFTEAAQELHEVIGDAVYWRFQTCYDCKFAYPAFFRPVSDRDSLRCFRDVPEVFAEIVKNPKGVSLEKFYDGTYFVNVFHRCSAWQRR